MDLFSPPLLREYFLSMLLEQPLSLLGRLDAQTRTGRHEVLAVQAIHIADEKPPVGFKDRMLELVAVDIRQRRTRCRLASKENAGADRCVRYDFDVVDMGICADAHELRDPLVAHFRLHDREHTARNARPPYRRRFSIPRRPLWPSGHSRNPGKAVDIFGAHRPLRRTTNPCGSIALMSADGLTCSMVQCMSPCDARGGTQPFAQGFHLLADAIVRRPETRI